MMKPLIAALVILLLVLQYKLWFGDGGLLEVWQLGQTIEVQKAENASLRERNRALAAEVLDLKQGSDAIEERARSELGMVHENETFFRVVDE